MKCIVHTYKIVGIKCSFDRHVLVHCIKGIVSTYNVVNVKCIVSRNVFCFVLCIIIIIIVIFYFHRQYIYTARHYTYYNAILFPIWIYIYIYTIELIQISQVISYETVLFIAPDNVLFDGVISLYFLEIGVFLF